MTFADERNSHSSSGGASQPKMVETEDETPFFFFNAGCRKRRMISPKKSTAKPDSGAVSSRSLEHLHSYREPADMWHQSPGGEVPGDAPAYRPRFASV